MPIMAYQWKLFLLYLVLSVTSRNTESFWREKSYKNSNLGTSLLVMSNYGLFSMQFATFEIFVFSALISAVDPVS